MSEPPPDSPPPNEVSPTDLLPVRSPDIASTPAVSPDVVRPADPAALRRARRILAAGLLTGGAVAIAGAAAGGFLGQIAVAGLSVGPFLLIGWLAHVGLRRVVGQALAWTGAGLLFLWLGAGLAIMATDAYEHLPQRDPTLVAILLSLGVAALLATPARRPLMRGLGLRPQDHVHQVALLLCVGLTAVLLAPLIGSGGRALLVDLIAAAPDRHLDLGGSPLESLLPLLWIIPGAFALVGYGVHRDGAAALDRLGLRWPTRRTALVGAGVGLALVPAALGAGWLIEHLCVALGVPVSSAEDMERLFDTPSLTIGSALALSIAAGVGEELAVRGVLQPRVGLVAANLFFASAHALQYTAEGVLLIFALGLALGELRRRTSTVTSMIAHATYDFAICSLLIAGS